MSDEPKATRQDEVEELLSQARQAGGGSVEAPPADDSPGGSLDQAAIEQLLAKSSGGGRPASPLPQPKSAPAAEQSMEGLLDQASQALANMDQPPAALPPGMKPFEFRSLSGTASSAQAASLDLLRDVQLDLKIELGRTHMQLEEVLQLKKGAVVTLDKLAGDPVDIFVNGRLIARGEVLVLNDSFCVRVAELIAGEKVLA
ncbi:MAG TPA: flagellar motor switch protein FliN [Lacipirellulaceae bacterium]